MCHMLSLDRRIRAPVTLCMRASRTPAGSRQDTRKHASKHASKYASKYASKHRQFPLNRIRKSGLNVRTKAVSVRPIIDILKLPLFRPP